MILVFREERIKEWNVFREVPIEDGHEASEVLFAAFRKIFKVITYTVLFLLILGLIILNKASLLLVTSQVRQGADFPLECQKYQEYVNGELRTFDECVLLPVNYSLDFDRGCLNVTGGNVTRLGELYKGEMCPVMILQWIWALVLIQCTPYVLVFLRNLYIVCFKCKKAPTVDAMVFVSTTFSCYLLKYKRAKICVLSIND